MQYFYTTYIDKTLFECSFDDLIISLITSSLKSGGKHFDQSSVSFIIRMKYTLRSFVFITLLFLLLVTKGYSDDRELPSPPDCGSVHSITKRVIGGSYSRTNEFPWMVLLEYKKGVKIQNGCGGVLVNKRYVLTAVHCLNNKNLGKL